MQQQQSNMITPQKIGIKKGMKMAKISKKKTKKMPSFQKVQNSVKKTMGY